MKSKFLPLLAILGVSLLAGCATKPVSTSGLNQARVSVVLKRGVTTQDQVLATYGAPNLITMDGKGREVWTYQQHAVSGTASSAGLSGLGAKFTHSDTSFFNFGWLAMDMNGSHFTESSKTATLIVKFDRSNTVDDFTSVYSSF